VQSAGFSGAPVFVVAALWFLTVAVVALIYGCCRCCCAGSGSNNFTYSRRVFAVTFALLIATTAAAM
jgi:hypothetical protein